METRLDSPETTQPGAAELTLAPKLDLRASTDLIDQLRAHRGQDIVLNAGAVEHLGAHALQTLLVAAKTWSAEGHALRVTPISATAAGHLTTFGLNETALQSGDPT